MEILHVILTDTSCQSYGFVPYYTVLKTWFILCLPDLAWNLKYKHSGPIIMIILWGVNISIFNKCAIPKHVFWGWKQVLNKY